MQSRSRDARLFPGRTPVHEMQGRSRDDRTSTGSCSDSPHIPLWKRHPASFRQPREVIRSVQQGIAVQRGVKPRFTGRIRRHGRRRRPSSLDQPTDRLPAPCSAVTFSHPGTSQLASATRPANDAKEFDIHDVIGIWPPIEAQVSEGTIPHLGTQSVPR